MRGRHLPRAISGLALAAMLGGCASIPTSGPVQTLDQQSRPSQSAPFDFTPAGPQPGASPEQIVEGFMTAQLATPVTSFVAREFLTTKSASSWAPDEETLVFDDSHLTVRDSTAEIHLDNPIVLDRQGRWMGSAPTNVVTLHLELENGEWRIDSPPNALMIPRSHFDQRFQRYSLYFFDRTGEVMVPEPVYLPWGVQAPTRLVSALLLGPPADLSSVERTYLPRGAQIDLSVPVNSSGLAVVPLTASATSLSEQDLQRAVAQVATTLGQLSNVMRVQLTAGGQALDYAGMNTGVSVDMGSRFRPSSLWVAHEVYGLEGKSVVTLTGQSPTVSSFPAFPEEKTARSLAISPNGLRAAVVAGGAVYTATQGGQPPKVVYQGGDTAPPHFDLYNALWIYDRSAPTRVQVVEADGRTVSFAVPLPSGFVPVDTAISDDGTRWVVAGKGGIATFRVKRSSDGLPLGLISAGVLSSASDFSSVAFVSPTRLIAVRNLTGTSDVPFLQFDGSSDDASPMQVPREGIRVFALATDPPVIYGAVGSRLYIASSPGSWVRMVTDSTLEYPTLPG